MKQKRILIFSDIQSQFRILVDKLEDKIDQFIKEGNLVVINGDLLDGGIYNYKSKDDEQGKFLSEEIMLENVKAMDYFFNKYKDHFHKSILGLPGNHDMKDLNTSFIRNSKRGDFGEAHLDDDVIALRAQEYIQKYMTKDIGILVDNKILITHVGLNKDKEIINPRRYKRYGTELFYKSIEGNDNQDIYEKIIVGHFGISTLRFFITDKEVMLKNGGIKDELVEDFKSNYQPGIENGFKALEHYAKLSYIRDHKGNKIYKSKKGIYTDSNTIFNHKINTYELKYQEIELIHF